MLTYIAIISTLSLVYAYFGYPMLLGFFQETNEISNEIDRSARPESICIIIASRNEEASIKRKIENTLSLSFGSITVEEELLSSSPKIQVIIADDSSDDRTKEIVSDFKNKGVIFASLDQRGGKERAQKNALKQAHGEIILFTDAKIELSDSSINAALFHFSDPSVGAISSIDEVIDESGKSGESAYVRYEMKIREMESNISTLVGLSGSCFAVRKEIAEDMSEIIPSDFSLLLATVKRGLRGRHAPEIIGRYKAVSDPEREFQRKIRTVSRGMQALFTNPEYLNPAKYGFFSFQLISHKIYRWAVPIFFLLLFFSSYFLSGCSDFWRLVWYGLGAFILLGITGYLLPQYQEKFYFKIPMFLLISNLAILIAWFKFLKGEQVTFWTPSDKG
jgi:cellulose synthase/poly-beta-1,6-N-acetylglucosamine synthase-like glycosyltransferase